MAVFSLCKPYCIVIGVELHLAALPYPPFLAEGVWLTIGTTVITPAGDVESDQVFGDTWGFVKVGSDNKYLRPHICLAPVAPVDAGLIGLHCAFGSSKTAWGPFSVKAHIGGETKNPAILAPIPRSPIGLMNQRNCCDGVRMPSILSVQSPNSVLVGFTFADFLGNVVNIVIDEIISQITSKLTAGLTTALKDDIAARLGQRLLSTLAQEVAAKILSTAVGDASTSYQDRLQRMLGADFSHDGGEAVTNWLNGQYE